VKTRYQFIHMLQVPSRGTTSRWQVCNNRSGDELGIIAWYGSWRQYCFEPSGPTVYSAGCLDDISHFIGQLKAERSQPTAEAVR
jgi:hypothetical protein